MHSVARPWRESTRLVICSLQHSSGWPGRGVPRFVIDNRFTQKSAIAAARADSAAASRSPSIPASPTPISSAPAPSAASASASEPARSRVMSPGSDTVSSTVSRYSTSGL
eukprot:PRCOL_00001082-RA